MQDTANKKQRKQKAGDPEGVLRRLYKQLPTRSNVVERTMSKLNERGATASASAIYAVIGGKSDNPTIAEAFVDVAEQIMADVRRVKERAEQLVSGE